jgi:hypothetical protein
LRKRRTKERTNPNIFWKVAGITTPKQVPQEGRQKKKKKTPSENLPKTPIPPTPKQKT